MVAFVLLFATIWFLTMTVAKLLEHIDIVFVFLWILMR